MINGQFYTSESTVRYKDGTEVTYRVLRWPGAVEVSVHETEEEARRIVEFANRDVVLTQAQTERNTELSRVLNEMEQRFGKGANNVR